MKRFSDIVQIVLIAAFYLCFLLLFFTGCRTQVVAVKQTHTSDHDSIRTEYKHDSIYVDRVHNIFVKGDTVRIHDSIYVEKWRVRELHDSIVKVQTDSIPYVVEVEKPVAYKSGYTRFTSWFFWIVLIIAIGLGVWKLADHIPGLSKYKSIIKLFLHIK